MGILARLTAAVSPKRFAWITLVLAASALAQSVPGPVDAAALARFERAVALSGQNSSEAIEIFEVLAREHPSWPEPYNNLAVLYAERGDEKKAEQALLDALGTHPTYALVHKNLEALYAGMAGRAYRKALKDESAGPEPPKLRLASSVGAATLAVARPAVAVAATEKAPQPEPEPAAKVAAASSVSAQVEPAAPESADDTRRAVLSTVASWLEAWSSQDVDRYLSFYGHHFEPGKGMTRDHWAAVRRKRVAAPDYIQIDIRNPSVSFEAADRASVRFLQVYRSSTFDGQTVKTLWLSRGSDGWKIIREETGG